MRKKHRKMSLKFRYILSSFSVAFIAFAVFGLILFFVSTRSLEIADRRQTEHKLDVLARNIEQQIRDMEIISFTIQGRRAFNWLVVAECRFNDITLLAELDRFSAGLQIVDNYFLLYSDDRRVYRSSRGIGGFTNDFDFFVQSTGIGTDPAELYDIINAVTQKTVIPVEVEGLQSMIIAYPVFTMGRASDMGRATLGFILCNELLYSYAQLLVGDFSGHIQLNFGDVAITISNDNMSNLYNMVLATAYGDKLVVSMSSTRSVGSMVAIFEIINALYIIAAGLFVLIVAVLWGYTNYKPVQSIISEKEMSELKRQEQYEIIKKQALGLMMSGDARYFSLMTRPLTELEFSGAAFTIIVLKPNAKYTEVDIDALTNLVEACSCEWVTYYQTAVANCYVIIANIRSEEYCEQAFEYIKDAVNKKFDFDMVTSEVVHDITQLHDVFSEILKECDRPNEVLFGNTSQNEIVMYVQDNYADHDMCLDKLSKQFDLSNRYISNIIKEETGVTYVEFMTGIRIKKATQLLLEGSLSIAETCIAVGYVHIAHFTKTFKRVTGYTPSGYVKYIKEQGKD